MDSEDEVLTRLLEGLSPFASSASPVQPTTAQFLKAVATLHAAALQSPTSAAPHVEYITQVLSELSLPEPVTLHPTAHSANTAAILSLKSSTPKVLHIHSPTYEPAFPHHCRCPESYLPLSSHTEAASVIASALRDAVSARQPVTLIVVHLDAARSLLPALPVAHALADRFNGRVHVTGPGCVTIFQSADLAADSIGLDLGEVLAVRGCGYLTFGVEQAIDVYGQDLLPVAVSARYALEKFSPERVKRVLDGVWRIVEQLSDALFRVEDLWQIYVPADGEGRIRYTGEEWQEVGEAVVANDKTGLLRKLDDVTISATYALRMHRTPGLSSVKVLAELLIRVAREYELVKLARSAFVARLRQSEHLEVLPCQGVALCALWVVPLGHVPPAGRWRKDGDARDIVFECTKRFAEDGDEDQEFIVVIDQDENENELRATVSPKLQCEISDVRDGLQMAEECERLSEELEFDEDSARDWGVRIADAVVQKINGIVEAVVMVDGGDARNVDEDAVQESEQEPDGIVEVVEDFEGKAKVENNTEVREEVADDGEDDEFENTEDRPENQEVEKRSERNVASDESGLRPETAAEHTTSNSDIRQKARPGFWGLIFGDKDSSETESDESLEDAEEKQLEDDYFRP